MRPLRLFHSQLLAAGACQLVETRPPIILRQSPLTLDPPALLDAVQRRIQRALFHLEHLFCELPNALPHAIPVHRPQRKSLQHQHVQRALGKFWFLFSHCARSSLLLGESKYTPLPRRSRGTGCEVHGLVNRRPARSLRRRLPPILSE